MHCLEYEIVVVTGNVKGAGTDANVFLTIFGKTAQSQKLPLRNRENENPFERNKSDVFILKSNCVGQMTKIRYINAPSKYKQFFC